MMFNYLWAYENINNNLELSMIEKCNILFPGNPYFNLLYADFLNRTGKTAQAGSSLHLCGILFSNRVSEKEEKTRS